MRFAFLGKWGAVIVHLFNVTVIIFSLAILLFHLSHFVTGIELEIRRKGVINNRMLFPVIGVAFFEETFVRGLLS